jgi:hypothetical protein
VRTLYVGHGPPAAPGILAEQHRYLLMVQEVVRRVARDRSELSEEDAKEVARLMERYLPEAPLAWLVSAGATGVAAELAQKGAHVSGRCW